ncbi:MAG TPA: hypothetical protein VM618_02265, partial [Acidimicrobiia bacterium]|nr:hypothetical protein [Acidimicrobiia bacterium]
MTQRRRRFQLGFGAGLVTMVLGALLAIAPVAGANSEQDPRGNNGTVKIDGIHPVDGPGHSRADNDYEEQHPDNDPHVLCQFELEFFGFDLGQRADIRIAMHSPTDDGADLVNETGVEISQTPAGGAGNDPDAVIRYYDLSEQLDSIEPHPQHGWHVKLYVTLYNSDGSAVPGGKKHKVFWIEECAPDEGEDELGIEIVKTNDADRDDEFTDDEVAPAEGSDVTFRLEITNTGDGDLTIDGLVDTWAEDQELDLLDAASGLECTSGEGEDQEVVDPDGYVLAPGATITCHFTVEDYAPAADGSLTNTVTVTTEEGEEDDDTSTVSTPPVPPTFSVELTKRNDANADGTFSDTEQAPAPGAAVTFWISIQNTGTGDLTLERLVDEWDDEELDLLDEDADLSCTRDAAAVALAVGSVLPAGSTTT